MALDDASLKGRLKKYIQDLIVGIETGHISAGVINQIVSESDLEKFVRIGSEGDATLLRILGYNESNVNDHPTKRVRVGRTQYVPDYVLHHQQKPLVVLELKRPDEKLTNKDWTGAVTTYSQQLDAPLGILFNGYALRVFINTQDTHLARYKDLFSDEPVAAEDCSDMVKMVDLLSKFSAEALQSKPPIKLAGELAKKQSAIIQGRERKRTIRAILTKVLVSSPLGDICEILNALAEVPSLWSGITTKPNGDELFSIWELLPSSDTPQPRAGGRTGANPDLRAKVAEVCGRRGWDVVASANIEGLRYRLDGNKLNGYHSVPQGPGVPDGLCVQGVSTPIAESIMVELKKL